MNNANMAPRAYTQDKRAEAARLTRGRILEATLDLYRERGIKDTTLKAVADKADVSRGTIIHHFGSGDGLLGAVLDQVVESLEWPDERIFEGRSGRDARIRAFVDAVVLFNDRSQMWWTMFEADMQRPELQKREAIYWELLARLQASALGPELAGDPRANAALLSIIHPATVGTFLWSFERAGVGKEQVRPILGDLAVEAVRRVTDRRRDTGGVS
jgi:AcrR family transcriptional regulator